MFFKKFKKGTYYIGDPVEVIRDKNDWENLIKETYNFENEVQILNGFPILVASTGNGDGLFEDNEGREYIVNSGLLGIIPVDAIERYLNLEELENIIEFNYNFEVVAEDGVFQFNDIVLDTTEYDYNDDFLCPDGCQEDNYNDYGVEDDW